VVQVWAQAALAAGPVVSERAVSEPVVSVQVVVVLGAWVPAALEREGLVSGLVALAPGASVAGASVGVVSMAAAVALMRCRRHRPRKRQAW
jgi:hypothetical protein